MTGLGLSSLCGAIMKPYIDSLSQVAVLLLLINDKEKMEACMFGKLIERASKLHRLSLPKSSALNNVLLFP